MRGERLLEVASGGYAALSQAAVSNALLIIGMLVPKLGLLPLLATVLAGGFSGKGVTSLPRSQALDSLLRATEEHDL